MGELAVAQHAGVSKQAVGQWRKIPTWRPAVIWYVSQRIITSLTTAGLSTAGLSTAQIAAMITVAATTEEFSELSKHEKLRHLAAHTAVLWQGPIKSPIDGKIYKTREDYARHMLEHGVVFAPDEQPPVKQKPQ